MRVQKQSQLNAVADEVAALTAVVRPILTGVLYALKADVLSEFGGAQNLKLKMLPRTYRAGDGDCGICFEYAVHEAMNRGDPQVMERIVDAAKLCKVQGDVTKSILFGLEKSGSQSLIATASSILTEESSLLYGTAGRPAKLKRHLNTLSGAFRNRRTLPALPYSIRGLWKADLFIGCPDVEKWVATTVKVNASMIEGAAGLRIGIVPNKAGITDTVRRDESKNLIMCPLNHDQDFMQTFYEAWRIVQAFINADARVPKEVVLPNPAHREVARILTERREFPILDVIEALEVFSQPELLRSDADDLGSEEIKGSSATDMMVAPLPRSTAPRTRTRSKP